MIIPQEYNSKYFQTNETTQKKIATTQKMSKQADTLKNTEIFNERQKNHEIRIKAIQGGKKQTTTRKYREDYPKTGSNAETEVSLRRSHSTMRATFIHTGNVFRRYYDITNDITGIS